jgi:hypothetical protein
MGRINASVLFLNKNKCVFFAREVKILGNVISAGKIKPDPDKIKNVNEYDRPKTIKELISFF